MITFEMVISYESYLQTKQRIKQSRKNESTRKPLVRNSFVLLLLAAMVLPALLSLSIAELMQVIGLLAVAIGLFVGGRWYFKKWSIAVFRKSPLNNRKIRAQLTENGVEWTTPLGASQLTWAAFTKAWEFDDGFLLQEQIRFHHWLPFAAMTEGRPEEAEDLIRRNIADFKLRAAK